GVSALVIRSADLPLIFGCCVSLMAGLESVGKCMESSAAGELDSVRDWPWFYRELFPRIVAWVYRFTGDALLSEEITQDSLIAAWSIWAMDRSAPKARLSSFAHSVAFRKMRTAMRD